MSTDRPSRPLREMVFARSGGNCQHCGEVITFEAFHVAHLRARSHGGTLDESNLEAWCAKCNLTQGARDAGDPRLPPRDWQLRALGPIVNRIADDGAATLSAAPGAGKTVMAGLVFEDLYQTDRVDRLVVLVPRVALVDQWVAALSGACQIQLKPNSAIERPGQRGVVVTYQSLISAEAVNAHRSQADHARTLVVTDEVHHIGERLSQPVSGWPNNVLAFVGELNDLHVTGVFNLSGTLWRSDRRERISTVRYREVEGGRLQSIVDFEVSVAELVDAGQLRPLDFYRMGAQVKLADYETLEYVQGNLADIDEQAARAAVSSLGDVVAWRRAFVAAVLDRLEHAYRSLNEYHVKALIVCKRQDQALAFEAEANAQMRERGLRPLAVHAVSDDGDEARKTLEYFRAQQRVGVLCTVDMAGEGYDCPEIAVIGYATNKLTALYVRQVVARAMRVTERERELGAIIPAAIVIPDAAPIVEQLVAYLAPYSHEIFDEGTICGPGPGGPDGNWAPRWSLDDVAAGHDQVTVALRDGSVEHVDAEVVAAFAAHLESLGVPPAFAPRAIIAQRRTVASLLDSHPFDPLSSDGEMLHGPDGPTIEDRAALLANGLKQCVGWWVRFGDKDIGPQEFNYAANQAGTIPKGGRSSASVDQLEKALDFAAQMVRRWCSESGQQIPAYARARRPGR